MKYSYRIINRRTVREYLLLAKFMINLDHLYSEKFTA